MRSARVQHITRSNVRNKVKVVNGPQNVGVRSMKRPESSSEQGGKPGTEYGINAVRQSETVKRTVQQETGTNTSVVHNVVAKTVMRFNQVT